jgi:hypothetical protein
LAAISLPKNQSLDIGDGDFADGLSPQRWVYLAIEIAAVRPRVFYERRCKTRPQNAV